MGVWMQKEFSFTTGKTKLCWMLRISSTGSVMHMLWGQSVREGSLTRYNLDHFRTLASSGLEIAAP